jgi:hypothetical protein
MQRTAEGDVHLLQSPADAEQRHAARDAGFRNRQRHIVAMDIVGFVPFAGVDIETGGMDVGARAGQHDPVDHIEQCADIGDFGNRGKHQGHRT